MKKPCHLYEVVISNSRVWLKVQASCLTSEQSASVFENRFTGTYYTTLDGHRPVTPFRLSERFFYISNWDSIVYRLPAGWDDDEFHIVGTPYAWCETLQDNCDCHGSKGRQDVMYFSDFGLQEETDKRESKTQNVRYMNYIREMEDTIARRDESQRQKRLQRKQPSPPQSAVALAVEPVERVGDLSGAADLLGNAINAFNRLVPRGFYCSIHGRHHPYGQQSIRKTMASLTGACVQISTWKGANRKKSTSLIGQIAEYWLQTYESDDCAEKSVWGDVEIPDILYKYIPKKNIGKRAPETLRATQLLALNDDLECNFTTMKGIQEDDTLAFLGVVQSKMEKHLGISVPWDELLRQANLYGDPRLSTFIQEYLNPLVGVVSFSTDILVPTMWAHYALNTGIVVGYETKALRAPGFELRPVVYSELAPIYQPSEGETIRLDFVDREHLERELRAGRKKEGIPLLARTDLAEFGAGWKSISRLLLVKGISWAYENEVWLLVDLEQARDIGREDRNGWPIKVIDPSPEAIKEIYRGTKTREVDVELAVQLAREENKKGLFVGRVSSHAFRMQKTGGVNY